MTIIFLLLFLVDALQATRPVSRTAFDAESVSP